MARKKHRREKNSTRRTSRASAEWGGPIGRPVTRLAGRPYEAITLSLGKGWLARPAQKMMRASWFLRATSLLPGRARPETQSIVGLLVKSGASQSQVEIPVESVVQGIAEKAGKRIGRREKYFGPGGDRKLKFRKLYGIVVATVTPLTGEGELNLEALGLL